MKKYILLSGLLAFFCFAQAEKADLKKNKEANEAIVKILNKYKKAKAVEILVKKEENKKALGTQQVAEGVLVYSQDKINFLIEKPSKSEIIYNKNVWIIEYPDLELDAKGHRKVTVLDSKKLSFVKKISQIFNGSVRLNHEIKLTKLEEKTAEASIKISKNDSLKEVLIAFDLKDQLISQIITIDDVDTESKFNFIETKFLDSVPKGKLNFKKLKSDEIFKP